MFSKIDDFINDSALARALLLGASGAAAVVLGIVAVVMGIAALAVSAWWVLGFVLFGLLTGVACGVVIYIYDEHCF